MAALAAPAAYLRRSFEAAMDEFAAEGRTGDASMIGRDLAARAAGWDFDAYTATVRADVLESAPRPNGFVPGTTWWWAEGDEWLGRIQIRHRLTPHLLEFGGHIGYDVRASARRRGHATAMLRAALPHTWALGIAEALITCDTDNVASRRVIEACGGRFEDQRGNKLRFWVTTAPGTVEYREARAQDADALAWIARQVRGVENWSAGGDEVVLAHHAGGIIGYGKACHRESRGDGAPSGRYLAGLAVHPGWRGRGVGGELARRLRAEWSFTNASNAASLRLHARLGFQEVGRADRYLGEPFSGGEGVLMRAAPRP